MGAKVGCVVLPGAHQPEEVFAAMRPILEQWTPRIVDCFVSRPTLIEPITSQVVTIVGLRSDPAPPGNSEVAEVLSAEFQTRALAVVVNDFFQSAGFQLWDRGRPRNGLHVEHGVDVGGTTIGYLDVPAVGLSQLFGQSIDTSNTLIEDMLAIASTGVDARLVENSELLETPGQATDPIDWTWNTVHLMWPAGEVLARVKLYQSD